MNHAAGETLGPFLQAARRRLWTTRMVRDVTRALWAAGALLLASGLIHAFVLPLPWKLCAGIAAAPPALALIAALLWRRPSLAATARESDRVFATRELFVSAWEQLQPSAGRRRAIAGLVLARAGRSAAILRPRLQRALRWTVPRSGIVPVVFMLLGLLLLLVPGAQVAAPVAAMPDSGSTAPDAARGSSAADAVTGLQRELARLSRVPGGSAVTPQPRSPGADAPAFAAAGSRPDRRRARPMPVDVLPHDATPSGYSEAAGDAPGQGRGAARADDAPPAPAKLATRYHDIPSPLDESAVARNQGSAAAEYAPADRLPPATLGSGDATAASERLTLRYHPGFSPSLRSYIAAYFKSIETTE